MSFRLISVAGALVPVVIVVGGIFFAQTKISATYNTWRYERSVQNSEFSQRPAASGKIPSVPEIVSLKDGGNQVVKRPCELRFPGSGNGKGKLSLDDEYCVKSKMADIANRYNTYYDVQGSAKSFDQFSFDAYGQMYDALHAFLNNPDRDADQRVAIQGKPVKIRTILSLPPGAILKDGDRSLHKFDRFLLEYMSNKM